MSNLDENLKMQKITRLLEKGGTMLAASHDCGAPMFRYQGKVLCPVCDIPDEKMKPQDAGAAGKPGVKEAPSPGMPPAGMEGKGSSQIAAMTEKKIREIAGSLENETDLQRIKEKMECIELGIKILKLLA